MRNFLLEYLLNEKWLGLGAGLVGVASILLGTWFLLFVPNFRGFALGLLVIGFAEAGVFLRNYYTADARIASKLELLDAQPEAQTAFYRSKIENLISTFFMLKIGYVILMLVGAICLSKINLPSLWSGAIMALLLHLGIALTIDNIAERHHKLFYRQIESVAHSPNTPS